MPIEPRQLLDVAKRLVHDPAAPEADLRRGVSTAYYALFHLLIGEVMTTFVSDPGFRPRVARALQHGPMKAVCVKYSPKPDKATGQFITPETDGFPSQVVPPELRRVAATFVELHAAREEADYDGGSTVQHLDANESVKAAEDAFTDWVTAQNDPAAAVFLQELFCRSVIKR